MPGHSGGTGKHRGDGTVRAPQPVWVVVAGTAGAVVALWWVAGGLAGGPTVGLALVAGLVDEDAIEELVAKIEAFEAGESVEFSAEHDGEVAHLYDAVGRLAAAADDGGANEYRRRLRERDAAGDPRYRDIVKSANVAIVTVDTDGTVRFANPAVEDTFGYEPAELVGRPVTELMPERLRDAHREAFGRCLETGERRLDWSDVEFPGLRADGEEIALNISFSTFERGGEQYFQGILRDVSEQQSRQRELRREREWREAIFQGSRDAIFISSPDGAFVDVNEAAADLTGYDREELLSMWIPELHEEHDLEAYREHHDRIMAGEPATTEAQLLRADGSKIPVEFDNRRIEIDGEPYMHTVARDVSERVERERERERYREYVDHVLDAIDNVFFVTDEDGSLRRWNDSLIEVSGYSEDELASMDGTDCVPDEHEEPAAAAIREVFETGSARLEAPLVTKDGETIPHEFIANRIESPDGDPQLVGIGRDVSEQKSRQRELECERNRLETLFENLPNPVLYGTTVEGEHVVRRVNSAFEEAFGYSQAEIEGEEATALIVPDERKGRADERLDRVVEEGSLSTEVVRETPEGLRDFRIDMAVRNPDADRPERYTVYTDITERKERERELERTRELLEQAQRVAGVGGWELDVRADPPELTWSEEVYRIHDLPTGETVEFDEGVGFYHPDDRPRVQERVERALEEGEPYDIEARLVTAEGDQRWVQSIAEPVTEDGEVVALRGSVQDITEQKERELALKSLHEVTCGLLETETDAGAAELVVDAAAEALGLECVGVYLFDSTSNRLEPVAHVDALGGLFEEMGAVETGADSPVWDCFVSGERAVLDGTGEGWRELTCESAVGGLLVPMGDHGVFVAATRDPALEAETRRLVETLVATAEAAFDRIETETSLRERDAELEAQNRRLRRQIQINDIIRQVDRSLVEAGSRAEIERTVCDRMVAADDIALAWIGSLDAAGNRLGIRQWVGSGEAYLDRVELATDAGDEPAVETVLSGEPTAVRNVLSDPDRSGWRGEALGAGLHSVLSVPLAFEEVTYGVLTVYSSEPEAFGDLERSVFAELGENIANSINAVETRQALHADTLVELTLELGADEDFLGRIARAAGCTVTYEGSATHTDEGARLFFRTADARPETVERVLEDLVVVDEYQLVAADFDAPEVGNAALFEATVTGSVLASRLVRHGGRPRSMTATPGGTDVVVAVPPSVEVREFVEMLRTSFPSVELVGRRTIERSTHTRQELVQSLLESLTDRQREVLQTAYHAGFFEWPRASTGEEVAAMLGVTQPTVNRHIRLAQQRLFAHLFEEGDVVLPDETV